ncbi:MAG: hypothetical protein ACRD1B_10100 [Thermoanaerobaculia bacterium]
MNFDSLEDRELETWIAQALRSIREEAFAGLDEQEALRRAQTLDALIVEGRISRAEIELDDTFKDVLYALVYRVLSVQDGEPEEATRHAMAIYDFIYEIPWDNDDLDEKQQLLNDCAAAGALHRAGDRLRIGPCGEAVCTDSGNSSSSAAEAGPAEDSRQTEIRRTIDSALPAVHAILVELYQLSELEARRLERELLAWFARFCRRVGNPRSRAVLLAATSEMARQYRFFEESSLESPAPIEARLRRLLHRALNEAEREWAWGGKKGSGG